MTAPLPLREPVFLRGRKSVLHRAILISLVLGALTAAAAWIVAATTVLIDRSGSSDLMYVTMPLSWGLASALLIYAPLNYWNRRSWLWSLTAAPVGAGLLLLFLYWMKDGGARQFGGEELGAGIGFFGVLLVSGLLQYRRRRLHAIAYLLSVAGAIFPTMVMVLIPGPGSLRIPGLTSEMIRGIVFAALFGGWFGALSIPWGLPFWWPPEDDASSPAQNSELLPDLLDR